jgi:ribosomal-protein-alanine N-acetyltransferase
MLLEVRPSNVAALGLYFGFGFKRIALRRGYYPAGPAREDAVLLELRL